MQILQILHLQFISQSFFTLHLNILNDSEFLKSVGRVCQNFGPLYTIESIPYFTADLELVINDLRFLRESFILNISLIIDGDKQFKNL